jgi:hypothetical protein
MIVHAVRTPQESILANGTAIEVVLVVGNR